MASVTDEDGQVDNKHETAEDQPSQLKTETDSTNNVHVPANATTPTEESLNTSQEAAENASSQNENDVATDESLNSSHEAENASSHHENDAAVDSDNTSFESQNHSLPPEAKNLLSDALKSPSTSTTESPLSDINPNLGTEAGVEQPTTVSSDHNEPDHEPNVEDDKPNVAEPVVNVAHAAPVSSSIPQPESEPKESVPRPPVEVPVQQSSAAIQNNEVSSTSLGDTSNRGHTAAREDKTKVDSSVIQVKPEVKKVEQPTLTSSKLAERTGTSKAKKEVFIIFITKNLIFYFSQNGLNFTH
jgi:hypothetical protein